MQNRSTPVKFKQAQILKQVNAIVSQNEVIYEEVFVDCHSLQSIFQFDQNVTS